MPKPTELGRHLVPTPTAHPCRLHQHERRHDNLLRAVRSRDDSTKPFASPQPMSAMSDNAVLGRVATGPIALRSAGSPRSIGTTTSRSSPGATRLLAPAGPEVRRSLHTRAPGVADRARRLHWRRGQSVDV